MEKSIPSQEELEKWAHDLGFESAKERLEMHAKLKHLHRLQIEHMNKVIYQSL